MVDPGTQGQAAHEHVDLVDDARAELVEAAGLAGMDDAGDLRVTDLWTGELQVLNKGQLSEYEVKVPKDKSPGGGVRAIKIERTG